MHEDWRGAGDVKEWQSPSFHFLSRSRLDSDIFSAPADVLCLSPVLFLILTVLFLLLQLCPLLRLLSQLPPH